MRICNPRPSDEGLVIQLMMLKQFQFKDSFLSCLKAVAMENARRHLLQSALAD